MPTGVKINAIEWLNMMKDFIVPLLGVELGLIMENPSSHKAKKALESVLYFMFFFFFFKLPSLTRQQHMFGLALPP